MFNVTIIKMIYMVVQEADGSGIPKSCPANADKLSQEKKRYFK